MRSELLKYLKHGWLVELMYLSKAGEISKRKVKIIKVQGDLFHAYCFNQHAKRTFLIDNVLAVAPVFPKERGAV
ncbi:transcriptional regulator [Psychrobacillus sp. FSL K6-2836]|uniref:transcriptional regulator n=1 Tax=Psychrobacillus sp. FSL K6-2836 TaxID=2921548 RepID=UPI0030FAA3F0